MDEIEKSLWRSQLSSRRQRLESVQASLPEPATIVRLLQDVDLALERLEQGNYGLCEACHEPIERERLLADPLICLCLDHLTTTQRAALEQDFDLALRIQRTLLPGRNLSVGGWETYYHYEPVGPVSGDYCDLLASDEGDGSLFLLMGDVSGKGVAASLLMSHLHAIFRSLISVGISVEELLERANRVFGESTMRSNYATLVCGKASPEGDVKISNAGHCPPQLVRRDGTTPLEATGLPLGLFSEASYSVRQVRLDHGDCLVLYTDGLTEAQDPSGEEYGTQRLSGILAQCWGLPVEALTKAVLADWEAFLSGNPKTDDLTLMVIGRTRMPQ